MISVAQASTRIARSNSRGKEDASSLKVKKFFCSSSSSSGCCSWPGAGTIGGRRPWARAAFSRNRNSRWNRTKKPRSMPRNAMWADRGVWSAGQSYSMSRCNMFSSRNAHTSGSKPGRQKNASQLAEHCCHRLAVAAVMAFPPSLSGELARGGEPPLCFRSKRRNCSRSRRMASSSARPVHAALLAARGVIRSARGPWRSSWRCPPSPRR
mmetsp:Transcript_11836/g.28686  ORF Transcript_11836/g.28686 Transcript_11836/m.28686 type:complete len:210 (+) Transcript_11836:2763-3392(+)